jgi:hypothetical protein
LIVAGLIEGFISPSLSIGWQLKFALAAANAAILFSYLFLAGRDEAGTQVTPAKG